MTVRNSAPPLPCTQGRGVGGEGREYAEKSPPHPNPSPPVYRGRGASQSLKASAREIPTLADASGFKILRNYSEYPIVL